MLSVGAKFEHGRTIRPSDWGTLQGEFETVKAVLSAAPILIAYLGGGSGLPVAEQCAWALGEQGSEQAGEPPGITDRAVKFGLMSSLAFRLLAVTTAARPAVNARRRGRSSCLHLQPILSQA